MRPARTRLTYANVMSSLAVFLVLAGGTAVAAGQLARNSVGTAELKRDAVTGAKVKDGSLRAADFGPGQLPAGPAGARGERGPQGDPGAPGPRGPSDAYYASAAEIAFNDKKLTMTVPPGNYVAFASMSAEMAGPSASLTYIYCTLDSRQSAGFQTGEAAASAPPGQLLPGNPIATEAPISLPESGTIEWHCERTGSVEVQLYHAYITAIRVDAVSKP